MPAMKTEVMVTVTKPPTIIEGKSFPIRKSYSSRFFATVLQVLSVMI